MKIASRIINKSVTKARILKKWRIDTAKITFGIIFLLGISLIISFNLMPSRSSWLHGKDGRRLSDLKQISNALLMFFDVCKKYPEKLSSIISPNSDINCAGGPHSIGIKYLPTDPETNQQYYYELISTGVDFKICTQYESDSPEGPSCLTSTSYVINRE